MASLVDNLNLNQLSKGFAGADLLSPTLPSRLAYASACQGGRRSDVMVHMVLKLFSFLCFTLVGFFVNHSFSLFRNFLLFLPIAVKGIAKCRS